MSKKDRDRRQVITPPQGVRAQTAQPMGDTWEDEVTGNTPVQGSVEEVVARDQTSMPRRVRETKGVAVTTLSRVEDVRSELQNTAKVLVDRVDGIEKRVDAAHTIIEKSVLPALTEQTKQNTQIITLLTKERDRSGEIKTVATLSQLKVTETAQMTDHAIREAQELEVIDSRKKDKDARREVLKKLAMKVITGLSLAAAAVLAAIQTRQC